ncbi:ABC transporter substrate-binding protein [Candidatus Woesearchaeota archaeon]|nr:ABC transporter substrate-binding protein [Candidatus Woesearchaeota archaeon]MBT3537882.1 ABC transporter substrate-binding protein [Candidatus Woesearchaeota archaeon]MBT4698013.1 ABC transporter substrate-binding protein [Candidatus Woesearchaeota archaeon]MBT4716602.1 ABC transporter substrate-binding protein [Candidatus Woesearchaeota archaeon]MBT7105551.1 ABC transporter substrate-binding protein [Candidatus Woesearchaeota archaeon]
MKQVYKVAVAIFMLVIIAGCSTQNISGKVVEPESIRIGSILILTGDGASWGIASRNSIDMAVEEINTQGGINGKLLEVIHEDDQSDPKKALSAFRKLTDVNKVDIIIGTTWSHTGLPLVDLADEKEVLMISPSLGVKDFNEASEFIFNTWPHDSYLSKDLADYVFKKGHRKVAIIGAQNVWVKDQTSAFQDRFEELGGEVVLNVEPDPADKDPYADAVKIKAQKDLDAIVSTSGGCMMVGALVGKQVRELEIDVPMYSLSVDDDTLGAAQGAYEGMEFLTFLTPSEDFEAKYVEKFKTPVQIGGDSAYDAVMLLAKAMRETGSTDTKVLQKYLSEVTVFEGVSGTLVSDGKGGFIKEYVAKTVQHGAMVTI